MQPGSWDGTDQQRGNHYPQQPYPGTPQPYGQGPQAFSGYPGQQPPPGFPGGPPPRKSKTPWIIGAAAVLVVAIVAIVGVVVVTGGDDESSDDRAASTSSAEPESTAEAGPPDSVTYEITGTSEVSVTINYAGSDGVDVEVEIPGDQLPWSETVSPAPDFASIWALEDGFAVIQSGLEHAELTAVIKQGDDVLETCVGAGPCFAEPAA